ncbi:hypothetical protein BSKO_11272 [Bryopsis sp. KO-2023]|nr:hypothetical protein BSKO_11272 [Bryopsis sp. KO-2023]
MEPAANPPRDAWRTRFLELSQARPASPSPPPVIPRILKSLQLDAERLDEELRSVLKAKLAFAVSLLKPEVGSIEEELDVVLQALVFYFTVWKCTPTPGQSLLNLQFTSTNPMHVSQQAKVGGSDRLGKLQRVLFGIGTIFAPYAWSKFSTSVAINRTRNGSNRLYLYCRLLDGLWQLFSLINLLTFLREGRYRNLLERFVGMFCVYQNPEMNRVIGWEVLNRQLIWHEVSELLLFVLPLLNIASLRSKFPLLRQFFGQNDGRGMNTGKTVRGSGSSPVCPQCGLSDIVTPYWAIPCGHVYCYYCLSALGERGEVICEACSEVIVAMKPCPQQSPQENS